MEIFQYPPPLSNWSVQVCYAQLEKKCIKFFLLQRLSKYICQLIFREDMYWFDKPSLYIVTNKMAIKLNMFCPFMKDRIRVRAVPDIWQARSKKKKIDPELHYPSLEPRRPMRETQIIASCTISAT